VRQPHTTSTPLCSDKEYAVRGTQCAYNGDGFQRVLKPELT
jgi:hypothetical protein